MKWTVLIPMRPLRQAKSRLVEATASAAEHLDLVAAMRSDTLAAVTACRSVARVVRVLDEPEPSAPEGVLDHVSTGSGLNGVTAEAIAWATGRWPEDGVAVLVGDLPSLRADELDVALQHAAGTGRSFVPDASGIGTTLLAAAPGVALEPRFGLDSALRHGVDAVQVPAAAGVRQDVDTPADLQAAVGLGVGPATLAHLARRRVPCVHLDAG